MRCNNNFSLQLEYSISPPMQTFRIVKYAQMWQGNTLSTLHFSNVNTFCTGSQVDSISVPHLNPSAIIKFQTLCHNLLPTIPYSEATFNVCDKFCLCVHFIPPSQSSCFWTYIITNSTILQGGRVTTSQ